MVDARLRRLASRLRPRCLQARLRLVVRDDARADLGRFVGDRVVERAVEFVQPVLRGSERLRPALREALGKRLRGRGEFAFGDEVRREPAAEALLALHRAAR